MISRRGFLSGLIAGAAVLRVGGPHSLLRERPRAVAVALPDFATENLRFRATERYAFGWTDMRALQQIVDSWEFGGRGRI